MNKIITKKEIITSLLWKLLERVGAQGISFLVSIILARLLMPEDYGLIAIIIVFITLANVFVQSGFNTALIQKKNADNLDFSTVFYFSLLIAGVLYVILFFSAPYIAKFYNEVQLISILRILSFTLFLGAINSIQNAVISRNMEFKKLFYSSIGGIIISGVVGILMAYKGYGVWAIVGQQLINKIVVTIIMWFAVDWRPKLLFSIKRLKGLLSYGWKILATTLMNTLFVDLRSLIIGKIYSPAMLGYYNRGKQFPSVIVTNINGSIQSVMLPAFSSQQDNRKRVKNMVRRSIVTSSFVIFPMMIGLAIVAEPLVKIILTEKWLPAVPFLQIYCITYAFMPVHMANLQAIKALGFSGTILKLESFKKILELIILLISIFYGVYAIALGGMIMSLISTIINAYPNKKYLNYSYIEQWKDIIPALALSTFMGLLVYCIKFTTLSSILTLIIQIFLGIVVYIGLAKFLRLESFNYLIDTLNSLFKKRGK